MTVMRSAAQLVGTLAIIAFLPNNLAKALALLVWWASTFGRLRRAELVLFGCGALFFDVMNVFALRQGVFRFEHPDVLGMPYYELVMWGFYLLHVVRTLGGPAPPRDKTAWGMAILYAATFACISDARILVIVAATLLAIAFFRFHAPHDVAYAGYMLLVGALVEYTGVWTGQWAYPNPPPGGVPVPFMVVLWGGVGLFLRRLILGLVARASRASPSSHEHATCDACRAGG